MEPIRPALYQALHEAGIEPDWVGGVSIGAINSAIIAGNPVEMRLEKLRAFWERITGRKVWALHAGWRRLSQGAQLHVLDDDDDASASPASSSPTMSARGSARPAPRRRRVITTPRRCAKRCSISSISTSSTQRKRCTLRSAR